MMTLNYLSHLSHFTPEESPSFTSGFFFRYRCRWPQEVDHWREQKHLLNQEDGEGQGSGWGAIQWVYPYYVVMCHDIFWYFFLGDSELLMFVSQYFDLMPCHCHFKWLRIFQSQNLVYFNLILKKSLTKTKRYAPPHSLNLCFIILSLNFPAVKGMMLCFNVFKLLCSRNQSNLIMYQLMYKEIELLYLTWLYWGWSIFNCQQNEFMIHPTLIHALNHHRSGVSKSCIWLVAFLAPTFWQVWSLCLLVQRKTHWTWTRSCSHTLALLTLAGPHTESPALSTATLIVLTRIMVMCFHACSKIHSTVRF